MTHKVYAAVLLLLISMAMVGCSKTINVDGIPISTHEYSLTCQETDIRTVFVLAEYRKVYEGDEYLIMPKYLDVFGENALNSDLVESLTLHIKVVNLKKEFYSIHWEIKRLNGLKNETLMYSGKLSRKDFQIRLPLDTGSYEYSFALYDEDGNNLYDLPQMRYKTEGGADRKQSLTLNL